MDNNFDSWLLDFQRELILQTVTQRQNSDSGLRLKLRADGNDA